MSARTRAILLPVVIALLAAIATVAFLQYRYAHADEVAMLTDAPAAASEVPAEPHAGELAPTTAPTFPDAVEQPSKAWQFVREMWRLGFWPALAGVVLLISRAVVARLKPPEGGGVLMYSGWRGKVLAIASALVAVFGPLFEVLIGTGPVGAIVTGLFAAGALLIDAFDPPKGAKRIEPAAGELFATADEGLLPPMPGA